MAETTCPVYEARTRLKDALDAGEFKTPKGHRLAEEVHDLLFDISWGRAGSEHLPAIEHLLIEWASLADSPSQQMAGFIRNTIEIHRETFQSHIDTRNCATGACVKLAPAPCQMTCPAGLDIPTYVTLIGMGRDAEAIDVIRKDCPFPWVCGLVCTRPCEFMCVRGRMDEPVSIKFLKAFAAERSMSTRLYRNPEKEPDKGQKVCIVGAGPAGLSCAYYLALKGYGVTVVEALPMAGGMIMVGIPRYRLPREVIDREVAMLEELGVVFRFNTAFGKDVTLDGLKAEGFEAFFFAIGAHRSYKLNIPGENDYPQVIEAVSFLKDVALGQRHRPGRRVVIVGGGNVAIDAARTSLRLGAEEVVMAYRRTRAEMPADVEEVEQAEEEGVEISFLTIPACVIGRDGKVTALRCIRAEMKEPEGGTRKVPVPIEGSDFDMETDAVISAIGQQVDHGCLAELIGLKWTRRNTIETNTVSMETAIPGIFAAGDAVSGPATVIEAIGGGKRAALAIDRYLSGIPQPKSRPVPVRRGRIPFLEVPATTKMILKRAAMPLLNIDRRRTTFQQVELGFTENMVREEARRCLRCDVCIRCGKCVDICRDKMGINALSMGYIDFDRPSPTDYRMTAERCILCGACAANCPTGAMQIEDRGEERILSLCGTLLNRQKLLFCQDCHAVLGTARYLEFIRKQTASAPSTTGGPLLCVACQRKRHAGIHDETTPV